MPPRRRLEGGAPIRGAYIALIELRNSVFDFVLSSFSMSSSIDSTVESGLKTFRSTQIRLSSFF
jgi:hypothetical protein